MRARLGSLGLITAAVGLLTSLAVAQPAGAILEGTDDTANQFESVGMLQAQVDTDEWAAFCSGTLVAPDVVLTAAHCTDFFTAPVGQAGLGPDDLRVSFDVAPDETSTYYLADRIVIHPGWLTAPPCVGNSKHLCLASPAEDIALVFLQDAVSGVTPSPIAGPGYLDELDVTSETFTVVGYGTDEFIKGSALSPNQVTIVDGVRSYREITAINTHDAFPDRFLKVTAGVCFGDSGGPMFHEGTIVGINTWTFSLRCTGPNLQYRTDSSIAQAFLDANL
jgi:secreted trypsin-like serine protease